MSEGQVLQQVKVMLASTDGPCSEPVLATIRRGEHRWLLTEPVMLRVLGDKSKVCWLETYEVDGGTLLGRSECSWTLTEGDTLSVGPAQPLFTTTYDNAHEAMDETARRITEVMTQREGDQPLPTGDETAPDAQSLVMADLEARRQVGIDRYGQALMPFNGRSTLRDAYEEALDLTVYLRSLLQMAAASRDEMVQTLVGKNVTALFEFDGGEMKQMDAPESRQQWVRWQVNAKFSQEAAENAVDALLGHLEARAQPEEPVDRLEQIRRLRDFAAKERDAAMGKDYIRFTRLARAVDDAYAMELERLQHPPIYLGSPEPQVGDDTQDIRARCQNVLTHWRAGMDVVEDWNEQVPEVVREFLKDLEWALNPVPPKGRGWQFENNYFDHMPTPDEMPPPGQPIFLRGGQPGHVMGMDEDGVMVPPEDLTREQQDSDEEAVAMEDSGADTSNG